MSTREEREEKEQAKGTRGKKEGEWLSKERERERDYQTNTQTEQERQTDGRRDEERRKAKEEIEERKIVEKGRRSALFRQLASLSLSRPSAGPAVTHMEARPRGIAMKGN